MRLKYIFLHLSFFLSLNLAFAQKNLTSPYLAIQTHLNNLEEDNYKPEVAANVFNPKRVAEEDAQELAIQLLQVFKGAGIYISIQAVPKETDYLDSLRGKHVYIIDKRYPQIYLEKEGEFWFYSQETVNSIDMLHRQVYPFGVDRLLELLPKLGNSRYVGLFMWQWIFILFIIILSLVIHKIFTLVIEKLIISFLIKRGHTNIAKKYVAPVAKPLSILIIFPILLLLIPVIQLPIKINSYLIMALKAAWPVFFTLVAYRLVDVLSMYMMKLAEKTESTLDDQLVPMVRKALKIFVIIVGVLAILMNLNINIVPLLTGLSIGGLAFALAAQDTLKNFFGSLMIFVDKPFQIGDWITSGDIDGTVEEVGFRATRLRTFRNSVTYVPNGMIADRIVDNHGLRYGCTSPWLHSS